MHSILTHCKNLLHSEPKLQNNAWKVVDIQLAYTRLKKWFCMVGLSENQRALQSGLQTHRFLYNFMGFLHLLNATQVRILGDS